MVTKTSKFSFPLQLQQVYFMQLAKRTRKQKFMFVEHKQIKKKIILIQLNSRDNNINIFDTNKWMYHWPIMYASSNMVLLLNYFDMNGAKAYLQHQYIGGNGVHVYGSISFKITWMITYSIFQCGYVLRCVTVPWNSSN